MLRHVFLEEYMAREVQRNRERRTRGGALKQLPWRNYRNPYKPIEVISADQIEAIHNASLRVLEEIGIDFLDELARARLKEAGAIVEAGSQRVRFLRAPVLGLVAQTPPQGAVPARNPAPNLAFWVNPSNF